MDDYSRGWTLVWADEFDGAAGSAVDADHWTSEVGGGGWSHDELQYYRPENAALDGQSHLAIVAQREAFDGCAYTSARLSTHGHLALTYGRVEARIKLPRGQGLWPAFWMVGWPIGGEIDIMEQIGREPRLIHGTAHGPGFGYGGGQGIGRVCRLDHDFADDFHVFAVDWDADAIRWYVDGAPYHQLTPADLNGKRWIFDHDFYINLNVAVGGHWPGKPDATTVFPQTMLVDYVRVSRFVGW